MECTCKRKSVCVGRERFWEDMGRSSRQLEYKQQTKRGYMTGTGESLGNARTHTNEYTYTHMDRGTHIQRQAAGPFVVHRDLLYYPAVTCPVGCMWPPAPTQQRVKWAEQPRLQGCRETRETQPSLPRSLPSLPPSLYLLYRRSP